MDLCSVFGHRYWMWRKEMIVRVSYGLGRWIPPMQPVSRTERYLKLSMDFRYLQ